MPPLNVLWILTDDQETGTPDETQCMPFLASRPHGSWVRFPNATLTSPLCGVSRANLLSGQRWDTHGVRGNDDCNTLNFGSTVFTALKGAGYFTGFLGKIINEYPFGQAAFVPAGVDVLFGALNQVSYDGWSMVNTDLTVTTGGTTAADYLTDVLRDKALSFLQTSLTQPGPFFLLLTPNAPHNPAQAAARHNTAPMTVTDPADFNDPDLTGKPSWLTALPVMTTNVQDTARTYRADTRRTLLAVDEMVQALIGALAADGRLNNTVIIYQTDNGNANGRKRIPISADSIQKRAPYYYSRDASLLVRWPGATQRTEPGLIASVDMTRTVIAQAGAAPLPSPAGRDARPLILNGTAIREATDFTLHGNGTSAITPWWALDTGRWLYVEYVNGFRELYDHDTDPAERVNVYTVEAAAPFAAQLATLKADPQALVPPGIGLTIRGRTVTTIRRGGATRTLTEVRRPSP